MMNDHNMESALGWLPLVGWFTIAEVAKHIGVGRTTAYDMVADGRIQTVTDLLDRRRVSRAELARLIDGRPIDEAA